MPLGTPGRVRSIFWWSHVWNLSVSKGAPSPLLALLAFSFLGLFLGLIFWWLFGTKWSSKGAKLGSMLGHFWNHFGWFLRVLSASQLKTALRCDFDRFLIDFRSPRWQKICKNHWFLWVKTRTRVFMSWSLLRPILDQFWLHFGSPNPTKSAPRGLQSRSKKWSKNLLSLGSIFKRFFVIFGPKWRYFFAPVKSQKSEKIRALGSKCDLSLQDGFPGTQNTQKSCKNEGRDYLFFRKILSSYDPRIKFHEIKMRHGGGIRAQRTG